jgi:glycosyltransferase involved in cell wall biosynthesis
MDSYKRTYNADCSIVVPFYNEEGSIRELYERLTATMTKTGLRYEAIFVDDGSTDSTLSLLKEIAEKDRNVIVVELRRNFGQTPALAAGFDFSGGRIVISMDGDLQHLPEEIPDFIAKIEEGYDVVSGWRKDRVDNLFARKIPSLIANRLAKKISGAEIHDFGTTFKAYRREIIEGLELYGEMHRFIPAILSNSGAKVIEIPITNVARPKGTSNYGISRTFRVVFDLLTLTFLLGYLTKPLHFFGRFAMYCIGAAGVIVGYVLYDKITYNVPIFIAHGPLAALAIVLVLVGSIFISTGLIGEMLSRLYFGSLNKKTYAVRGVHRRED